MTSSAPGPNGGLGPIVGVRAGAPGLGSKPACGELAAVGSANDGVEEATLAAAEGTGGQGLSRCAEADGVGVEAPHAAITIARNRIEPSGRTAAYLFGMMSAQSRTRVRRIRCTVRFPGRHSPRRLNLPVGVCTGATAQTEDVLRWFDQGTSEARITALGLMEGDLRLEDFGAAIDAVGHSRSAFEQYHGLVLAREMVRGQSLTAIEVTLLGIVVERALRNPRVRSDSDRRLVGEEILADLEPQRPARD